MGRLQLFATGCNRPEADSHCIPEPGAVMNLTISQLDADYRIRPCEKITVFSFWEWFNPCVIYC
jgi:hypothetical protein